MKRNSIFTIVGLLIFLLLCFVPNGGAQQANPISQSSGTPWQLGLSWTFNSSSPPTNAFNIAGISYYRVLFASSGTVSGCSLAIDSSSTGSSPYTSGGILSAGTIGSCASPGMFVTSTAAGVSNFGRLTPTITGSGQVTVVLFGYTDNPAAGGSIGGSVAVTNFPSSTTVVQPTGSSLHTQIDSGTVTANAGSGTWGTQDAASGTSGSAVPSKSIGIAGKNAGNLTPVATDSTGNVGVNIQNTTATQGPTNVTSTQAVVVTAGGASEAQITVTGTWTGTIQPKISGDGSNYINTMVHPTNPVGPWQSTITANGTYAAPVAAGNSFEAIGNTVATGTAVVTVVASPGVEDVVSSGLNTPADAAGTPVEAVHTQSWPMGWNGSSSDRLRTAGVGNGVAATGILAASAYCEYLTSLPSLTTGQYSAAQCDSSGRLLVSVATSLVAGGNIIGKIAIIGSTNVGLDAAAGASAATNSLQAGGVYNSSPPAPSTGQQEPLQLDSAGNLLVNLKIAIPAGANTIGKVDLLGNAGAAVDAAAGASAAANSLQTGGVYNSSLPSPSTGQQEPIQLDSKGQTLADLNYVLGAIMSATNPLYVRITDGITATTSCISAYGSAPTGTECPAESVSITNNSINTVPNPTNLAVGALTPSPQSALTTAVVVKASAGNIYGFQVTNGAASVCYLEFINAASAPSLGTAAVYSFAVPASGTLTLPPGSFALSRNGTGISVGMATAYNGSTQCGTAATGVIFYD
jgi:hypothetical protein